jgi:hypothetical protein
MSLIIKEKKYGSLILILGLKMKNVVRTNLIIII